MMAPRVSSANARTRSTNASRPRSSRVFPSAASCFDAVRRRDAGVVGAGNPERFVARQPAPAHEQVLHGVVQPVAHVQDRRHVRRRHHEHERWAIAAVPHGPRGIRAKNPGGLPLLVEGMLGRARVVLRGDVQLLIGDGHC
jgi:hypothetical protein